MAPALCALVQAALGADPAVIVDEDFTTGSFREQSAPHWRIASSEGVAFQAPNNRAFDQALSRTLSRGTTPWAGATWAIWDDHNGDGQFNDGEMRRFGVRKADDVCVVRFRAFSDVASATSPWIYGVEVAMLEWYDDFCDNFHYCHDLQWEARQVFLNNTTTWRALHLIPNVENIGENSADYPDNDYPFGVRYAHFETNGGVMRQSDLDRAYDNLVIFRPAPERNATNFELWGEANHDDYMIDTAMNSTHDPDNPDALFDHIQITLFRNYSQSHTSLIREGVDSETAQVGILNLHVGITRRADFTLDYVIDARDIDIVRDNLGRADSASLLTGDATNDNRVDMEDASAVCAYWSEGGADAADGFGEYDPNTGEIRLNLDNASYFSIECLTDDCFAADIDLGTLEPALSAHSERTIAAITADQWTLQHFSLGPIARTGLQLDDFRLTVNSKGSGAMSGFVKEFDLCTGARSPARTSRRAARIAAPRAPVTIALYSPAGRVLHTRTIRRADPHATVERLRRRVRGVALVRIETAGAPPAPVSFITGP
jgi:hypothetical protein